MEVCMSTTNEPTCPVAILNLPKATSELLTFARGIHSAMDGNAYFPNPDPPLTVVSANIDALEEAETKAATRARGAAELRDVKKKRVKDDLTHICDYVQSVVEASPNGTGAAIIKSAGMSVKKVAQRSYPEISAKNADVSGKVLLAAKSVGRGAVYVWEYSADRSTWTALPESMLTRAEIAGLNSACTYYFRFRAFTRAGWQDYSQVVSLLVH
jgi:hypothetical protein